MASETSGIVLAVHVQPRASRSEVVGWRGEALAIRLTSPPVDGAANRACRDFLAETLGLRRSEVELIAGEKSREKRFRLSGISQEQVRAKLP